MMANVITSFRLLLTFVVIYLFKKHIYLNIACIFMIGFIFALDAVDGYVARKRNETTTFGAVIDIAADRIIENVLWIYFAVNNLIPLWMPIAVVTRGFLTDGVRSHALIDGKTPFEMMSTPWTRALTSSRISRFFSGASKALAFISLATVQTLTTFYPHNSIIENLQAASMIISTFTVLFCLIRGVPVLIDGWKYTNRSDNR